MITVRQHDWGLIVAGILLLVLSLVFIFAPGLTLVTLTAFAGAGFLISGVFDIVSYVRLRQVMELSGWTLAYAILDVVLGLMFLLHPLALAGVIPWVVGLFLVLFGAFELCAALRIRSVGAPFWGWAAFSGVVGMLCGLTFFLMPTMFSIFLAVFLVMRGISLLLYGWNVGKAVSF